MSILVVTVAIIDKTRSGSASHISKAIRVEAITLLSIKPHSTLNVSSRFFIEEYVIIPSASKLAISVIIAATKISMRGTSTMFDNRLTRPTTIDVPASIRVY